MTELASPHEEVPPELSTPTAPWAEIVQRAGLWVVFAGIALAIAQSIYYGRLAAWPLFPFSEARVVYALTAASIGLGVILLGIGTRQRGLARAVIWIGLGTFTALVLVVYPPFFAQMRVSNDLRAVVTAGLQVIGVTTLMLHLALIARPRRVFSVEIMAWIATALVPFAIIVDWSVPVGRTMSPLGLTLQIWSVPVGRTMSPLGLTLQMVGLYLLATTLVAALKLHGHAPRGIDPEAKAILDRRLAAGELTIDQYRKLASEIQSPTRHVG